MHQENITMFVLTVCFVLIEWMNEGRRKNEVNTKLLLSINFILTSQIR